jgi:hypothetical protein
MALLVADSRSESFDKPPPPKKKWIQNYLVDRDSEPDSDGGSSSPNPVDDKLEAPSAAEAAVLTAAAAVAASSDKEAASGAIVQSVINQFQEYIHQQTNRNLHHQTVSRPSPNQPLAAADVHHQQQAALLRPRPLLSAGQLAAQLLDPLSRGGDKFNDSLQKISTKSSLLAVPFSASRHSLSSVTAPAISSSRLAANDSPSSDVNSLAAPSDSLGGLSQKEIGGVVQGVISQFLTGSLADVQFGSRSGSSSSRKRCRRGHEKCPSRSHRSSRGSDSSRHNHHHHSSSGHHRHSGHNDRGEGVLVDNTNTSHNVAEDYSGPQAKYRKSSHEEFETDAGGVLNLSLPKTGARTAQEESFNFNPNSRVTFAAEDSCYSAEDSQRSMEISKSQQMYNADEALDLDIKSTSAAASAAAAITTASLSMSAAAISTSAAALLRRQSQNSYHSAFYPPEAAGFQRPQSSSVTGGYIKPVPLSTLIKAPASLSPQGSPSPSPPAVSISAAPVNLIVKPVVSEPTAVIQNPQLSSSSRYSQQLAVEKYSTKFLTTPAAVKQYSSPPPPELIASIATKRASPVTTISQSTAVKKETSPATKASPSATSNRRGSKNAATDKTPTDKPAEKSDKPSAENSSGKVATSTRELHNQLEKNRRAQLKLCFEELAGECQIDPKTKASNLTVIRTAYKVVMGLRRDERENEKEIANLAEEKIKLTQRLEELRRQLPGVKLAED